MVTRNEALIITAALALAIVPRFEAKVQQYAQSHRTEIQMAMNELQGKPAIPFAAPEAAPVAAPAFAVEDQPQFEMAAIQEDAVPRAEMVRAQMRAMRPLLRKVARLRMDELAPQLASLRVLDAQNASMVQVYRLKTKKCPLPPATPAVPTPASFTIETGSLP